jgi:hypothetical protein
VCRADRGTVTYRRDWVTSPTVVLIMGGMAADDGTEVNDREQRQAEDRRSRRRGVSLFIGFVLLVAVAALWLVVRQTDGDQWKGCPADALLGPDGQTYGRSPDKNCQFVDENGNVVDPDTVQVGNG